MEIIAPSSFWSRQNRPNGSIMLSTSPGLSFKLKIPSKTYALTQYRVKDWLHGVRPAQPDRDAHNSTKDQALTDGERYRLIHHIITVSKEEGGAGITPKHGEWENVESVYPIHDPAFNKEWIKKWSTTSFLKAKDLDEIRDKLGEKVHFLMSLP